MQKRRLLNLPQERQAELRRQFPWLRAVVEDYKRPENLRIASVTVFDHWLSRDEANELLENIPPEEQATRVAKHAKFCGLLTSGTPVLSFVLRGRAHDLVRFREFTSQEALSRYCTPEGGQTFGHRHFQVVLPDLDCAFFESWDDTHRFYFTSSAALEPIYKWAAQCGLYILEHA